MMMMSKPSESLAYWPKIRVLAANHALPTPICRTRSTGEIHQTNKIILQLFFNQKPPTCVNMSTSICPIALKWAELQWISTNVVCGQVTWVFLLLSTTRVDLSYQNDLELFRFSSSESTEAAIHWAKEYSEYLLFYWNVVIILHSLAYLCLHLFFTLTAM